MAICDLKWYNKYIVGTESEVIVQIFIFITKYKKWTKEFWKNIVQNY